MEKKYIIIIEGTDTFVMDTTLVKYREPKSGVVFKVVCVNVEFGVKGMDMPKTYETQKKASEALFAIKNVVPVQMKVIETSLDEYRDAEPKL